MSSRGPSHIHMPPKQDPGDVFSAPSNSALDTDLTTPSDAASPEPSTGRRDYRTLGASMSGGGSRRVSNTTRNRVNSASFVGNSGGRASFTGRRMSRASWVDTSRRGLVSPNTQHTIDGEGILGEDIKPAIPSLAVGIRPAYSTPLPLLPMVVLCIAMLSEFLSANTPTPFLLKMVESFFVPEGQAPTSTTEAQVGLWTGNLVSVFFITQFLTSLLWSGIADRYGRRAVLVASLLGSAISLVTFGTSGSLPEAICVRLCQGIFGGSIGVFRGSIRDITDSSNEARAYAMLGFSWGLGGVIGPILGGVFESPAKNHPGSFFGKMALFEDFPYLLPCILSGAILTSGALLATRLSWDGGPKRKRIALPLDDDQPTTVPASPTPGAGFASSLKHKASSILSGAAEPAPPPATRMTALREQEAQERARRSSMMSVGTAYGYGGVRTKRETMAAQAALAARRDSTATVRANGEEPDEEEHISLAQRFLMANEENTFNINDLWVSAAIAQETAVFEDDVPSEDDDIDEGDEDAQEIPDQSIQQTPAHLLVPVSPSTQGERSPLLETAPNTTGSNTSRARLGVDGGTGPRLRAFSSGRTISGGLRRLSSASGQMPALFANTGLVTPPPYEQDPFDSANESGFRSINEGVATTTGGMNMTNRPLEPIIERRTSAAVTSSETGTAKDQMMDEKPAAAGWRTLPMLIILQYGLLAFHDTIHGQVFLSFLISAYKSGGLGLFPSSFSLLIAMMCLCQLYYQFYLYPHLGPPRGRLNHLQMFRLGSWLFIPAYLTLPLLRFVATEESHGGFLVMTLLTFNMAIRYCGGTLAYTSIMVLINASSPPPVVNLANSLGQAGVSLARFVGPVIGGAIWSASIAGHPDGYINAFYICCGFSCFQIVLSYLIR